MIRVEPLLSPHGSTGPINTAQVALGHAEAVGLAELLDRLARTCWEKCAAGVQSGRLSSREAACADACVDKYLDAAALTAKRLQQLGNPPPVTLVCQPPRGWFQWSELLVGVAAIGALCGGIAWLLRDDEKSD